MQVQLELLMVMTDASKPTHDILTHTLPADSMAQLLALRGLLAHGLLMHVLQKRHAVDYGINRSGHRNKIDHTLAPGSRPKALHHRNKVDQP